MLSGTAPFGGEEEEELFHSIQHDEPAWTRYHTREGKDLCRGLLRKFPQDRLTDEKSIRQHSFFKFIDWGKLERKEVQSPITIQPAGKKSTEYFEKNFTQHPLNQPSGSDVCRIEGLNDDTFKGFSFVAKDFRIS